MNQDVRSRLQQIADDIGNELWWKKLFPRFIQIQNDIFFPFFNHHFLNKQPRAKLLPIRLHPRLNHAVEQTYTTMRVNRIQHFLFLINCFTFPSMKIQLIYRSEFCQHLVYVQIQIRWMRGSEWLIRTHRQHGWIYLVLVFESLLHFLIR